MAFPWSAGLLVPDFIHGTDHQGEPTLGFSSPWDTQGSKDSFLLTLASLSISPLPPV